MADAFKKKYGHHHALKRQQPLLDEAPRERSKSKKKPWTLWSRWIWKQGALPEFFNQRVWIRDGRYKTKEEAEKARDDRIRKQESMSGYFEQRHGTGLGLTFEYKIEYEG